MDTLATAYLEQAKKALAISKVPAVVTPENVYQQGDPGILSIIDGMAESLLLPGSGVEGMEHLEELLAKTEEGKSCLLLLEHYSNFDLTLFSLLVRKAGGRGEDIAKALVAVAGMKLNEDNPMVAAFAGAYTRLVIYPSRSLSGLEGEKYQAELNRSNAINFSALKTLDRLKTQGRLILVFPAGTRFRPWDPESKKGLREIDSYIRTFDYMCCVAVNGEILHVQKSDMMNDAVSKDIVRITAGPVQSCAEFREKVRESAEAAGIEDKRQASVDAVMAELDRMHGEAEEKRKKL
ncbi:MAG: 1-acyl-sn-glycerol-3-phosphate acyltransferase [Treponema sp.]|nr:1-acyl-sn-glycerol-3-phosphate acyltransferase [Treponema sp.]MCL2127671.1 1-acyl-sn-glycerol-3-phosphate acyltransferase [Treponema sp.]